MRLRRFAWWLALAAFVFSALWIGWYLYQAYFGVKSLQDVSGRVQEQRAALVPAAALEAGLAAAMQEAVTEIPGERDAAPQDTASQTTGPQGAAPQETALQGAALPTETGAQGEDKVLAAYAELARWNPDMVGWVYIEGTVVDYPVMHTPQDPEKYLHLDFEGEYSFAGLPFLDAQCDPGAFSANMILYAHNMRSGQMFAPLNQYLDPAFRQAHPTITFDTLHRRREYEVVAVLRLLAIGRQEPSMRCYRQIDTTDPEAVDALNEYLDRFASVREGKFQLGDDILTLSTCRRVSGTDRLVVMARRVPDAFRD
ncbi:MAG: class B sortase [Candidatus Limiplasma sp.]|nr:class B sortase [Candidatus Limiplasma sp.]